jgi:hypothetical protein
LQTQAGGVTVPDQSFSQAVVKGALGDLLRITAVESQNVTLMEAFRPPDPARNAFTHAAVIRVAEMRAFT